MLRLTGETLCTYPIRLLELLLLLPVLLGVEGKKPLAEDLVTGLVGAQAVVGSVLLGLAGRNPLADDLVTGLLGTEPIVEGVLLGLVQRKPLEKGLVRELVGRQPVVGEVLLGLVGIESTADDLARGLPKTQVARDLTWAFFLDDMTVLGLQKVEKIC